ncbi:MULTISPECIES: ATP-binding protein [Nostocales]|uniref:ATP-binding protein n=3 Tax=Nostocales TaxID=1161 RepID=A0A0C1R655_9CYAN|nr:ATP-binding protein [Tolypothrix bouteillei]KAF3887254.1 ATP-binding protein [Tolypothrix bouteillei VB521301]
MSNRSEDWNLPKSWNCNVLKEWHIDRLLTDLEATTQKRYRQDTRKDLLLGLLCGYSLKKISIDLLKKNAVVRTSVSSIYRDIEALTGEPDKSVKSGNLVYILERHGYRKGASVSSVGSSTITHNLPAPTYTEFIGREPEMKLLLQRLSPNHAAHIITVDGIGGVGKTALVLAAAYHCLKASQENLSSAPKFEAIIFTSAKQQELIPNSILRRNQGQRNLRDIFREIAHTLNDPTIIQSPLDDQFDRVRQSLSRQRTMLIVDNMETIEETEQVISFLYDLPARVKVVLTTRERIALLPISLRHLPLNDGLKLIQQQAEEKGVTIAAQNSSLLYQRTGGIPLAIVYAIGQVSSGYSMNFVLERLASATSDVARFCFEQSVQGIKEQPAHKLLMSIAIFPDPPILAAVAEVAGLTASPDSVNAGLARLQQLSLVNLNQETGRYEMLSLTREYVLAELAAYPDFEREARKRWVNFYQDFAQHNAGEDWEKWIHYSKLDEEQGNLRATLYWCKAQERYEEVRDLWLLLYHYANLYSYWDDRLHWLQWLIEQSERRGEWSSFIKFSIRKSWLLIRMCSQQNLKEAEEILRRTWVLRDHADLCVRADLAEGTARLKIRQKMYQDARYWLTLEEELVQNAQLEERQHTRYIIPVLYHRAEIFHSEYEWMKAKALFQEVIQKAENINWYRVMNSAQNWLADIAIEQGEKHEAQQLITKGLTVAESSNNKRRLARYQRSFARWERQWGSAESSRQYAIQAMNGFNLLGMLRDAEEMKLFLDTLG